MKLKLIASIRCCGEPPLFLAAVCMMIGILFLTLDSGAGWIFVVAAVSVLAAFGHLGARGDMRADLRSQRLPLAPEHV